MFQQAYRRLGKRALDLSTCLLAGLLLLPVSAAVAALVRCSLGSPVIFRQQRAGLQGKPFVLFKFRTMRESKDDSGKPLADEKRLTKLGTFLRSTSLDELPQLINVLRGEMSLVGPRPLLVDYLDRYNTEQARRHEVKPGITGWAQVHGRNAISWEEKFKLDVWYVDHLSFWTDVNILLKTAMRFVRPAGVSASGHATMPEFTGSTSDSVSA